MKTMKVQLVTGHIVEIEDAGLSYCSCFSLAGDGRIIGLGRNAEGNNAVFFWKEVDGLWKHHFTISLRVDEDGDDLLNILTHNHVMLAMGQRSLDKNMNLIIIT